MRKIGILVDKIGRTQKFYTLCNAINKMVDINTEVILFFLEMESVTLPTKFSMMPASKCLKYDGILISTCGETTRVLHNNQNAKKKYHYVWDLDWSGINKTFEENRLVYTSDVDLIARSQDHYEIISNTWKEPCLVIGELDGKTISGL